MSAADALPLFAVLFANAVSVGLTTFLVGALVMLGSVQRARNVVEIIVADPFHSFRVGLVVVLAALVTFLPLFVLSPETRLVSWLVWFPLAGLLVFGRAFAFLYVGTNLPGGRDRPITALVLGSATAFLVSLVPVVGQFAVGAFAVLGAGGVVGRVVVWSQSTSTPATNP